MDENSDPVLQKNRREHLRNQNQQENSGQMESKIGIKLNLAR